jgi:hypothetical protein
LNNFQVARKYPKIGQNTDSVMPGSGTAIGGSARNDKGFRGLADFERSSITMLILYLKVPSFGKQNRGKNARIVTI